ncbi:response regulator [Luteolibacter pohnpeiensis]|uniref:Response regulator n=1 Tax=Luteolibacter pohnpeiensis TaxID=454153 RepID=A0A934SAT8_9BACT|nr:response regulator [Luteolibacter pohnpeiensis]MBK1884086.1 response regulator [Luteolibacter pohnpeiensis]
MNPIRCLIIDDESLARERVASLLESEPDIQVVDEAGDGVAALEAIERHRPDLLFLDIQMPRLNGFEVLEAITSAQMPAVIFTTAYDNHAVRAFEVSAVDYLLKPFSGARFKDAVARARSQIRSGPDPGLARLMAHLRPPGEEARVLVKTADRILFVPATEIDHVESAGNYLVLHCGADRHIVRETMVSMAEKLADSGFMRISRSVILNLSRIRELRATGAGNYRVILKSGSRLDMTIPLRELQERMTAG